MTNPALVLAVLCSFFIACGSNGNVDEPDASENVPSCDVDHLSLCDNSQDCVAASGYWYDDSCHSTEETNGCDADHLALCENESDCVEAGGQWSEGTCQAPPEFDDSLLVPSEGGEGTRFNDGASWYSYNNGAHLEWVNEGGDYVDADGVAQGSTPWAVQTVSDTNSVKPVTWDVRALVQAWADEELANRGFHIRWISGGGGPINYATKEATELTHDHPTLTVETASGLHTFTPTGDTRLNASSRTATFGQDLTMQVRNDGNSLVWFDLTSLVGEEILAAELTLTTVSQFSTSDTEHGIFATKTERWDTSAPVMGIAEAYPNDVGLASHPDVYLAYSLDTNAAEDGGLDLLNDTVDPGHAENYWPCDTLAPVGRQEDGSQSTPAPGIPGYIPHGDGNALCIRVKYEDGPLNTQGIGNYGAAIRKMVSEFSSQDQVDELFVRVYVFFGDTWGEQVNSEGGKRPGGITGTQAGTAYAAGWGGRRTDGTNGWSARGGYFSVVPTEFNPLGDHTPLATYLYHADQDSGYGDSIPWGLSPNGLLKKGRWYCIEQQVKMNTRDGDNIQGVSGANDGIVRGWVDGRLVFERTDVRFTDMDYINIDTASFSVYYGGFGNTPWDQHLAIDNLVVSKSYIGPMK